MSITHISDTALWVACYRALESERPDALFRDPYARRLAGERGFQILDSFADHGKDLSWPLVTRTVVMDEIIMRHVSSGSVDTVLNLAAGLDARPWRLPLPASLRWYDADFADMIDYKLSVLGDEKPACQYIPARVDLSDGFARRELLREVGRTSRSVLVITEGLLVYLPADNVTNLARDLHDVGAMRYWLMDLASPALLKMLDKTRGKVLRAGNAPMVFGPAEGTAFFSPLGWHEIEYRAHMAEGIRINRTFPMARVWAFIGRFMSKEKQEEMKRFSGIVVLERNA